MPLACFNALWGKDKANQMYARTWLTEIWYPGNQMLVVLINIDLLFLYGRNKYKQNILLKTINKLLNIKNH